MQDENANSVYQRLYRLAFENPRVARNEVERILDGDEDVLLEVLGRVSQPGNGRLRQIVANAIRSDRDRERLRPHLRGWLAVETDEFARRAIKRVIQSDAEKDVLSKTGPPTSVPSLATMYRYVSGRLGHELRNAMLVPKTSLIELRLEVDKALNEESRGEIAAIIRRLEDDFATVGRVCAFDPKDEHFIVQSVVLSDWIRAMNAEYSRFYNTVELNFNGSPEALQTSILASHHYLRLVFWNLWLNSHQATGDPCKITIHIDTLGKDLKLTLTDNGDGIPDQVGPLAFNDHVTTRQLGRGRGLLEIQCAMEDLHGNASIARQVSGELRVTLTFPKENR